MQVKRWNNIVAIKQGPQVWGYHVNNLEVAELNEKLWNHLETSQVSGEIQSWSQYQSQETLEESRPLGIRYFSINIAQACNLDCVYCAAGDDASYGGSKVKVDTDLVFRQLKNLLSQVPQGETFEIRFFGGEPLLYPEAIKSIARDAQLLALGRKLQLKFSIITNGTLVTPQVAELLAQLNTYVVISMDGPSEDNDRVRPTKRAGQSSTQLTLKGLSHLIQVKDRLRGLSVNGYMSETQLNLVETYRFLRAYPFDSINLGYITNSKDGMLSPLYLEKMTEIAKLAWEEGGLAELMRIAQFKGFISTAVHRTRVLNHCGAGRTMLQTDTLGKLYPCQWWAGDPGEELGQDRPEEELLEALYEATLIETNDCHQCWAKYLCGGGCMFANQEKTGHKNHKDLAYCARTRGLASLALSYLAQFMSEEGINGEWAGDLRPLNPGREWAKAIDIQGPALGCGQMEVGV